MTYDEILQKMKTTPWNWYYVGGGNDPDSWEKYRVRREELDYIGSDINTMGLPAWCVGVDTYDFSGVDKFLDALLKDYPARYFVPRIKMDPPLDWLKENPKDVCVYYGGPTSEQEIAEMVGSKYHDRNGWDDGKTRNPYPDQRIANQSFSSKKWVEDACKALSAFVEHIETVRTKIKPLDICQRLETAESVCGGEIGETKAIRERATLVLITKSTFTSGR
jgi:hypothetical protein